MAAANTPPTGFQFEADQPFDFGTVLSNLGQPDRTWSGLEHFGLEQSPANALGNGTTPPPAGGGNGGVGNPAGNPAGGTITDGNPFLGGPPDNNETSVDGSQIGDGGGTIDTTGGGAAGNGALGSPPSLIPGGDFGVPGSSQIVTGAGGTPVTPATASFGGLTPLGDTAAMPLVAAAAGGVAGGAIGSLSSGDIAAMNAQLSLMGMSPLTPAEVSALTGIPGSNPDAAAPPPNDSPVTEGIGPDTVPTGVSPAPFSDNPDAVPTSVTNEGLPAGPIGGVVANPNQADPFAGFAPVPEETPETAIPFVDAMPFDTSISPLDPNENPAAAAPNPVTADSIAAAIAALGPFGPEAFADTNPYGPDNPAPTSVSPIDAPNPEASPQDSPAPADPGEGDDGSDGADI